MKTVVFIENAGQLSLLKKHNDLAGTVTAIVLDDSLLGQQRKGSNVMKFVSRKAFLSDQSLFDVNAGALQWLKEWSCKPLSNGKTIKELFTYHGVSLWWFMDFWLHYHELHKATTKEIIAALEIIDAVVKKEKPDSVLLLTRETIFQNTVAQYCQEKDIRLVNGILWKENIHARLVKARPYLIEFLKYRKFQLRRLASKIIISRSMARDPCRTVLCGLASQWGELTNPATGEAKKGDAMLQPVIDLLRQKRTSHLVTELDFTPTLGLSALVSKRRISVPLEYYSTRRCARQAASAKRQLLASYASAKRSIAASLSYKGVSLWPLLKRRFDFAMTHRLPEAVLFIEAYKSLLDVTKATSMLVIDETGLPGRAATVAGQQLGRKVVGLQHGYISSQSFEYMHLPGEIDKNGMPTAPFCPIPAVTAVYGKESRALLIKAGYPKKSIAVTGQPRYDVIQECRKRWVKEDICRGLSLDPSRKIVIYITQPSKDRFLLAKKVFSVIAKSSDVHSVQLVIKVHPRETGFQEYERIARQADIDVKVLNHSLFKLLFACDVVVQRDSVVGLEAMMFGKPVICTYFIFTDIPEVDAYFREKACRIATTAADLRKHLHEALSGTNAKHYAERQEKYVHKASFNMDGKSAKRVVGLL